MAPSGWLDIHAHFMLPSAPAEAEALRDQLHAVKFMVPGPVAWSPEPILSYNDRANVRMQMLSYIPPDHAKLRAANDYGASMVARYSSRFGLLAALPTNDAEACLDEIRRVMDGGKYEVLPDGFATMTVYNGVGLGDERLEPVWKELNRRKAVVHIHPNAYAEASLGRPAPLIEVAFDTARTVTDMLYNGLFRRHPDIRFVLGHCGGALPVLSGRLSLLGTECWVPNPNQLTREEIETQLSRLYVDTAATASTGLPPAVKMVGVEHCVYGADCGVPCSTEKTMEENKNAVLAFERETGVKRGTILMNGWNLFPDAAKRAEKGGVNGIVNGT